MFLELVRDGSTVKSAQIVSNTFKKKSATGSGDNRCYIEITPETKEDVMKILNDPTKVTLGSMLPDSDVAFVDTTAAGFSTSACGSRKLDHVDTSVRRALNRASGTSFFKNL